MNPGQPPENYLAPLSARLQEQQLEFLKELTVIAKLLRERLEREE